jgi:hypothetical protein
VARSCVEELVALVATSEKEVHVGERSALHLRARAFDGAYAEGQALPHLMSGEVRREDVLELAREVLAEKRVVAGVQLLSRVPDALAWTHLGSRL